MHRAQVEHYKKYQQWFGDDQPLCTMPEAQQACSSFQEHTNEAEATDAGVVSVFDEMKCLKYCHPSRQSRARSPAIELEWGQEQFLHWPGPRAVILTRLPKPEA